MPRGRRHCSLVLLRLPRGLEESFMGIAASVWAGSRPLRLGPWFLALAGIARQIFKTLQCLCPNSEILYF